MSYRIGSFNCHNFKNFDSRDLQCFADIISKEQFDIVALQEILLALAYPRGALRDIGGGMYSLDHRGAELAVNSA